MQTIALFGAAGKIGTRLTNKLRDDPEFHMLYVESGDAGMARLRERGLGATDSDQAAAQGDVVILAVPDKILGKVAHGVVPKMKSGALLMCLDPAAPHGKELPQRADIGVFVAHPCHPPVINDETALEAKLDFFGGIIAKQNVICALFQGTENDYLRGEQVVRRMFAPVMNTYRVTVEQMALMEPALSETLVLTCMFVMKEGIDEAVKRGVPAQAARDFILGHININIGFLFGYVNGWFSDGAILAVERAKKQLFQPDWKKIFEPDNVMEQVKAITEGRTTL